MKGVFAVYRDILSQSNPGTPGRPPIVDQPVAGQGTGENLSEIWSKKTPNVSVPTTPNFGTQSSLGTLFDHKLVGGTTPIEGNKSQKKKY